MSSSLPEPIASAQSRLPLFALLDLQDHLLTATNDLARLETLLDGACATLIARFRGTTAQLRELAVDDPAPRDRAVKEIAKAVTALQFQDMASQLIAHTTQRLRYCADRLGSDGFGSDADGAAVMHDAPLRPNPVTQSEMDTGTVDLF
ncbi:MAG: hypothetical protein M3Y67_01145 [Pseudomonadota bacterium]|nr:hypothetical protein [Pseudomonadota bacterium]